MATLITFFLQEKDFSTVVVIVDAQEKLQGLRAPLHFRANKVFCSGPNFL